jgi:hypothetical protein
MTTQRFEFLSNGNRLSGTVDVPSGGAARAMIVIIHGYVKTDVAGRTYYYDLRSRLTQLELTGSNPYAGAGDTQTFNSQKAAPHDR